MVIPLYYAIKGKSHPLLIGLFAVILVGIWFTAVYTAHHYLIDVLLGIACALVGIFVFEKILLRTKWFSKFFNTYYGYIR